MKIADYECQTTFWEDFSIADVFGEAAVEDTFDRAFAEWKDNYIYLTELVMVLNHKCWQHYVKGHDLSQLYCELFYETQDYAYGNLKGEELNYFYRITD